MTIMKSECSECGFEFIDESLIFYIENDKINETPLTLESSKLMSKSELAGYLYISYCNECKNYIKTYIPEIKGRFDEESIIKKINSLIDNSKNTCKILLFDFDDTSFSYRRKIISENNCPVCDNSMCLLIDEFHPCPKCGKDKIITVD